VGADGFIGAAVVAAALAAGARIVGLTLKRPWRLAGTTDERASFRPIERERWGFSAAAALRNDPTEAVLVLGYVPPSSREADAWRAHERDVNLRGVDDVVRAAGELGARVVFASSADVLGSWVEDSADELTAPDPATPYADAKLSAEAIVSDANGVSLRIATVYGPGENGPRAIPSFARAFLRGERPVLHGGGLDSRDYVHVTDVATAFVNAGLTAGIPPVLNVGSGVPRNTRGVLAAVAAAVGVEPDADEVPSPRAPTRLVLDIAKARACLQLEPRVDFAAALAEELAWLAGAIEVGEAV